MLSVCTNVSSLASQGITLRTVRGWPYYKLTGLFLLSAHITMWYKEYYKLILLDQAVYGSTNTKYRVYRNTYKDNTNKTHTMIHRKRTGKTSDRLVNGARWAFQCFVYNTNKITDRVAQWVARLTRYVEVVGSSPRQRPPLFTWARNYTYCL